MTCYREHGNDVKFLD